MSGRGRVDLVLGGILVGLVAGLALAGPLLAPGDPLGVSLSERLRPPGGEHLLGTDELGRDLATRLLHGGRSSLAVAVSAAVLATVLGLLAAALSYLGGKGAEAVIFRLADLLLAFPGALLAVPLAGLLGPGRRNLVIALAVTGWVAIARLARAELSRWKSEPFVEAAVAAGSGRWRIFRVHLLPQVMPVVLVQGTLLVGGFVLAEGALSFLGLGIPPPHPSWGAMLDAARGHLLDAPHLALFPAAALVLTTVGLGLAGDGLIERFDPGRR